MQLVHVAVAVIQKGDEILIAHRPEHVHLGGLWEFPGGKVEPGETVQQALKRELCEELGIEIHLESGIQPLLRMKHDYSDRTVLLDVWRVSQFTGEPKGLEGQPVRWVSKYSLTDYDFPEGNKPIIAAVNLPQKYLITGDFQSSEDCYERLQKAIIEHGVEVVQFRSHDLRLNDSSAYIDLANSLAKLCRQHKVLFMLNAAPSLLSHVDVDGVHLTAAEASLHRSRPIPANKILGISCHNEDELICAKSLSPDYVILSPVKETQTHVDVVPLGWSTFQALADNAPFPVFALGGMTLKDMRKAQLMGAQGIAAIREWW